MIPASLEKFYQEARAALKIRNYDRASELFRQILLVDENYKDASRLLAQTVNLRRRRWFNHPMLWGGLGLTALIGLGIWLAPKFAFLATRETPQSTTIPTATITPTGTVAHPSIPSIFPSPTTTPIPLAWKRISMGQEFPRDIVVAIVVNPNDPDVIYAGMQNAGIYKSIDGGNSWQPANKGLTIATIDSLVINPDDPNTLYAGIRSGGVFKTTDGGITWLAVNQGISADEYANSQTSIIAISPRSPETIYFLPGNGTYNQSVNGGLTWRSMTNACPALINSLAVSPDNSEILLAASESTDGCEAGIYKSIDGGKSWGLVFQKPGGWIDPGNNFSISLDGKVVLFNMGSYGSYLSSDEGSNWRKLDSSKCALNPENISFIVCLENAFMGHSMSLDGGISFHQLKIPNLSDANIINFISATQGTILVGGNGLSESMDGGSSWISISNGLGAAPTDLRTKNSNVNSLYIAYISKDQVYFSPDDGNSWDHIQISWKYGYRGSPIFDADGNSAFVAAGTDYHSTGLARSFDNGRTWAPPTDINICPLEDNWKITAHTYIPGMIYLTCSEGPLYISHDQGISWDGPFEIPGKEYGDFFSFSFSSEDQVYFLQQNGIPTPLHSMDAGKTWSYCSDPGFVGKNLVMDPQNPEHVFLGSRGHGVWSSQDGCQSWQKNNTGLSSLFVNTLAVDPKNPDMIYAGADGGAYVSFNGGESWNQINDGLLGATVVYSIVVNKDGNVYAATPYGVFILKPK